MLINGPPQIVQRTPDADEHLIEVPRIPGLRSSPAQSPGEVGTDSDTSVSTIALFDGSAITKFDVLPASASRLL